MFPADSGFFYAYYPPYDSNQYSRQDKIRRIREFSFANAIHEYEKRTLKDELLPVDFTKMTSDFEAAVTRENPTARDILCQMIRAYVENSPVCSGEISRWVEKTTSSEIYANVIREWFPDAKYIHVIRDPRDNFGSLKSGWKARYQNQTDSPEALLQSMIDRGKLGFELAKINQSVWGENCYWILKYEDLVKNPEATMRAAAQFIGISYDPILLKPSAFGALWRGNNFDGKVFSAIDPENAGRWQERITEHEAKVLEFHFRDVMRDFGYSAHHSLATASDAARKHYQWFNYAKRDSINLQQPAVPSP